MKKMLASLLAAALVATCTVPVFAAPGQPQAAAEGAGPDTILLGDASSPYNVTVLSSEEIDLRFGASTMSGENNKVIEFEDPTTSDDNDDNSSDGSDESGQGDGSSSDGNDDSDNDETTTSEGDGSEGDGSGEGTTPDTKPSFAAPAAAVPTPTAPASKTSPAAAPASSTASPAAATAAPSAKTTAQTPAKTYKGVEGYVDRMYDFVLGRGASSSEIEYYVTLLKNGSTTAADVAYLFFNSKEFKEKNVSDKEYVALLYKVLFNRGPAQSESDYYVSSLKMDSRNRILSNFINSGEFENLCSEFGITRGSVTLTRYMDLHGSTARFVERLYKTMLGRGASDDEIENRVQEIINGYSNAAQMGFEFANSPEFTNSGLDDSDYVRVLYITMLDRGSANSEVEYYANLLNEGVSRNYVYLCFIYSPEFQNLCATYGVPTGEVRGLSSYDTNMDAPRFALRMYKQVLGRWGASAQELRERTEQLVDGAGAAQMVIDFFLSAEFANRNLSDADYVTTVYKSLLDRGASSTEVKYYVDLMEQGASRNYVLSNFLNSPEFQNLCNSYGVKLGTAYLPDVTGPNSTSTFDTYENGLDVSSHQGSINWSSVKAAGYDFVIVRATSYAGGLKVDPYFYENVRGAKKAGLKVGAYAYTYSYSKSGVDSELNTLFSGLAQIEKEGYRLDYPVFWDVEANNYTNQASKSDLTDLAKYAIDSMRAKGYYGALYTYTNFANTRLDMSRLASYDLWIAQYGPRVTYGGSYTMWQYTSSGRVSGISGNVDLNYSYKDYEKEIKNGGWNHW